MQPSLLLSILFAAIVAAADTDVPLQIVRPASNHRDLELVESNLLQLKKVKGPVALVGVVGKFHSGKSFLMNQLMGKAAGFGLGPSVKPKTMGIWMWGKPLVYDNISIVFLDTEGFAASNVTENYDAKVFAVSTLLSSHLLYNSVKIIDQLEIEYLELLARRTQLFALRSQLSKSKWTANFDEDMLTFPPLTWVVQDFVQLTNNQETSTQWLHRLMGSHSRENENHTITLLDIFETVDCHTLPVPAHNDDLLTDLSQARESDLNPNYIRGRDDLIKKLKQDLHPKERSGTYVTGADLAQLLAILVSAANDGSLAEVPSRWGSFIERLQSTASEDCATFYLNELDAFLVSEQPISMRAFDTHHQQIKSKAFELLEQLLQGLDEALITARRDLSTGIEAIFLTKRDLNEKKIKLKCNSIRSKFEMVAEERLKKIVLPLKTSSLLKQAEAMSAQLSKAFQEELVDLIDVDSMTALTATFEKSLNSLISSLVSANKLSIEKKISAISELILKNFENGVAPNQNRIAKKPSVLLKIIDQLMKNSEEDYKVRTLQYNEEDLYQANMASFRDQLSKYKEEFIRKNEELASNNLKNQAEKSSQKFANKISDKHLNLPMDESRLNKQLSEEGSRIVEEFETQFSDFKDCCGYDNQLDVLKQRILAIGRERQQENIRAYREIVNDTLKKAKEMIKVSEDKYSNPYSFKKFVTQIASSLLSEGKSASWDVGLKTKVIDDFIREDPEITALLESKKGILATILGIIEYLLSFIGL